MVAERLEAGRAFREGGERRDMGDAVPARGGTIGLQALLFAAAGICGSVIASVLLYRLLFRKKAV